MNYAICQIVKVVDMNGELIREQLFEHGQLTTPAAFSIGCSVITHHLGLKEFDVVHDYRLEPTRYRIVDIEFSMISEPPMIKSFLEPIELIVGQHDIGAI